MKTSELTGHALDWAAAECAGLSHRLHGHIPYSTDWAQGGPIIEREGIDLQCQNTGLWRQTLDLSQAISADPTHRRHAVFCGKQAG
jgi:hypothetical protein